MNQITLGLDPLHKKTRKEVFLEKMNKVVPWQALVALIQPHARGAHQALGGRPPFAVETMLRIHCLQLWWNLSDPAMERAARAALVSPLCGPGRRGTPA
jgi:IS5 family transposase